jgi:hypothetical protein
VIERAVSGPDAHGFRHVTGGLLAGIETDQIVHPVAAWPGGFEKAGIHEVVERRFRAVFRPVGESGRGSGSVGGGFQEAEQEERVCGVVTHGFSGEVLEADRDAVADRQVGVFESVKAAVGVGELIGQMGQRTIGLGSQARRRDAQREGKAAALPDDLLSRLRLGPDPAGIRDAGEQGGGVGVVEAGQPQMAGVVE